MRNRILCAFVLAVTVLAADTLSQPLELFVATNGNDAWTGRLSEPNAEKTDGPFATLERARDAIRALKKAGPLSAGGVTVFLRGGIYSFDKPFELSADDTGTAEAPIAYAAYNKDEVRLVGGKVVTGFAPVTDAAVLERLDEPARSHVLQVDLKALGVTDFGAPDDGGMQIYFQDKPMTVSRWPNEGFVRIVDIVVDDGHKIHGIPGSMTPKFVYDDPRPERWASEKEPWLHGYWFWDWSDQRQKINSIDTAQKIIELDGAPHGYGYRKNQWYYAFNMLCELDTPGEWYVDRETGILYFWPPAPVDSAVTLVSILPTMATLKDVSHVTLRGLTMEAVRGTALSISGGAENRVAACTFCNIGANAVSVSGGTGHGVVGCDIYQMGRGGISLSGGDRTTLTPAGLFAENNHIHHYGQWARMYQTAIQLSGVGNRASHNLIHDAPHMAIGFGGNDHVIEFNEIHNVCMESNDAGAMYAGRDWTMRGHVIRNNYLHHVTGFEGRGCVGVYLDDMFASADIAGNVFYKVTMAAFIGGGRDNTVENNIFVDCNPSLHIDARALGWAAGHADGWIAEQKEKGTVCGMAYNKPPYSERYPKLVTIIEDEPKAPKGNLIARNISWGGKWDGVEEKARGYQTFTDNLIDVDPLFATPERFAGDATPVATDFALKPESPAFAIGFKAIPLEQIGLFEDANRATWPVEHPVGPSSTTAAGK